MFGEFLVAHDYINRDDLHHGLKLQRFRKIRLGRMLLELEILTKNQLDIALRLFLKPDCPINTLELIERKKTLIIPLAVQKYLRTRQSIAVAWSEQEVVIVRKSFSDEVIENIEKQLAKNVILWLVNSETYTLLENEFESLSQQVSKLTVTTSLSEEEKLEEDNPFAKIIKESFDDALKSGVSDIHFEPYEDTYIIRHRHHGTLNDWKILEKKHAESITNKLKSIINMDLAIVGKPQDARAGFNKRQLDIRASSFPVIGGGEKIVLRLQRRDQEQKLENLGLSEQSLATITDAINKPDGLVVISGPTGSGKTTTLYAMLATLDRFGKNISTLENPVEKKLARINQANIMDYKSFADFEKALMRQDPDIILIGEVRDRETAELCIKLSATGHLVLSTIHANGAMEVVERFKHLGVDEYSIRSNIRLSIAQRLVKKLCPDCSIRLEVGRTCNKNGCKNCHNGVVGRIAMIETLNRDEIKTFLHDPLNFTPSNTLLNEAKVLATHGIIDYNEVKSFEK